MYKVKIFSVGKTKEDWLQEALEEYTERLKGRVLLEWILAKNDTQLKQFLEKQTGFICLDPRGKEHTSETFSHFLIQTLQKMGSRLTFVIGGPEGIPEEIKAQSYALLSLSQMTLTHQIARLILIEQIYRALEIDKGTAYHK